MDRIWAIVIQLIVIPSIAIPSIVIPAIAITGSCLTSANIQAAEPNTNSSQKNSNSKKKVVPPQVWTGLEASCLHCHEGDQAEGGFDLSNLSGDLSNPAVLAKWVRVHDRTETGEMPPPDDETLDADEREKIVSTTSHWISWFENKATSGLGRVRGRRLSNMQLEQTLHQLLAIDTPLAKRMPAEPRSNGFHGIAEAQSMSHFHLQTHLEIVDHALDSVKDRLFEPVEPMVRDLSPKEIARRNPRQRNRDPELRNGLALVWSGTTPFYGRMQSTTAPDSGWYRITLTASAERKPKDHGVWCSVRSGPCVSNAPLLNWIGSFEAQNKPKEHVFEGYIEEGDKLEVRPGDRTLKTGRFQGGQIGAGEGDSQDMPGMNLHHLKMERFYPMGDVNAVKKAVFGDLRVEIDRKKQKLKVKTKRAERVAADQLATFLNRAFRRPVTPQESKPYIDAMIADIEGGTDAIDALFTAYRGVLCSPRFIYLVEQPRDGKEKETKSSGRIWLDDHSIANRLSYFLTGGPPDAELRKLADQGALRDRTVLVKQVDRLLKGDGLTKFVEDFAGQWLDLVDIDFTEPDRKLYRDFDIIVQNAMVEETHRTLGTLIRNNAPVEKLIRPGFTFLNSRLARFYEIDADVGDQSSRVPLPKDSVRGGLLANGAVLKVTANGTDTSPVLRGVWVSERILGYLIPPPPENVPAVEPDIRGATTIRDQLQKHTEDVACAACHRTIDPPGYALENFDPSGKWRDRYQTGRSKRKKKQPAIDPSFQMPDGETFDSFNQFRTLVCEDSDRLAQNFAAQLLTYATGAPIRFSDRSEITEITKRTAEDNHRLRSIVDAVVTSPTFISK